jgi:hypothetical protein
LLRNAVIKFSDRVDAMVVDIELKPGEEPSRPDLPPELEARLREAEDEITRRNRPPEPEPAAEEPPVDPNVGLDPADPKPWPVEVEWIERHFPGGIPPAMAQQLTESFHFLLRCGIERGSRAYFIGLEARTGLNKPRRKKHHG